MPVHGEVVFINTVFSSCYIWPYPCLQLRLSFMFWKVSGTFGGWELWRVPSYRRSQIEHRYARVDNRMRSSYHQDQAFSYYDLVTKSCPFFNQFTLPPRNSITYATFAQQIGPRHVLKMSTCSCVACIYRRTTRHIRCKRTCKQVCTIDCSSRSSSTTRKNAAVYRCRRRRQDASPPSHRNHARCFYALTNGTPSPYAPTDEPDDRVFDRNAAYGHGISSTDPYCSRVAHGHRHGNRRHGDSRLDEERVVVCDEVLEADMSLGHDAHRGTWRRDCRRAERRAREHYQCGNDAHGDGVHDVSSRWLRLRPQLRKGCHASDDYRERVSHGDGGAVERDFALCEAEVQYRPVETRYGSTRWYSGDGACHRVAQEGECMFSGDGDVMSYGVASEQVQGCGRRRYMRRAIQ